MNRTRLNVGRIPYANLFPMFHYLDKTDGKESYRFVRGVPSTLNKMLRKGDLDISPSSSIEYLRYKNRYVLLPWFSISSLGPIKSIMLFSRYPLRELNGKMISVSSESETSTVLLKIILEEFFSLKCKFRKSHQRSVKSILSSSSAVLLIGDTAMLEAKKAVMGHGPKAIGKKQNTKSQIPNSSIYTYDLGELWNEFTGLPFVYALWVVRKNTLKDKWRLVEKLSTDLTNAKKIAHKKLASIAKDAPHRKWFSEKELVSYWKLISYDFSDTHMEGLRLFEKYALRK